MLKNGAMPSRVAHQDPGIWGNDAVEFSHCRFLPGAKRKRPSDVCSRAFGGGKSLCPECQFPINEIDAVVTVFVLSFDVTSVNESWDHPIAMKTNVAAAIMEPGEDLSVVIETRRSFEVKGGTSSSLAPWKFLQW